MGKGRIISGGTDGSYTVELLHNRDRITAELDSLAAQLTQLQSDLDALETEREGLAAERSAIATEIDEAVASAEEGEIPDVEALLVELSQVSAKIQTQDVRIALIQGWMLEARKRQQMLQAIPADPQQQAWCADFTEDLTGEVGTVEVPAEGVVGQFATWRRVIVRPGYTGRATYSTARDGQMFHREGQTGHQAYFNAAILPGVQRHKPQYRIGTISSIDAGNDTCSLSLQPEDSSAQSLIIDPPNLQYQYAGVPVEYMDCNADAFEEGDRVLIEFQGRNWGAPKVIGFESQPRMCGEFIEITTPLRWTMSMPQRGESELYTGGEFGTCSTGKASDRYATIVIVNVLKDPPFDPVRLVGHSGRDSAHILATFTDKEVPDGIAFVDGFRRMEFSLSEPFLHLGETLHDQLDLELWQHEVLSLYSPFEDDPYTRACLTEEANDMFWAPSITAENMPVMEMPGGNYSFVGFKDAYRGGDSGMVWVAIVAKKINE